MTLIASWKDSLRVLTPQGLKELGIATWGTIKEVCTIFYAKWFIILASVFCVLAIILRSFEVIELFGALLIPLIFLAALPVSQKKDFKYFVTYLWKYSWGLLKLLLLTLVLLIIIALIVSACAIIMALIGKKLALFTAISFPKNLFTAVLAGILGVLLSALGLAVGCVQLVMLFYFTKAIPMRAAIKNSLTLICYNFPLMAVYFLIELCIAGGIEFMGGEESLLLLNINIVFAWLVTCFGITLYLRRINADPALYQ